MRCLTLTTLVLAMCLPMKIQAAEIAVLSNANWEQFAPSGKEADCILGDYALKSDRLWVVIAQPASWRNANMTVRQVGGAVIDLTTLSSPNDQLSAFYPGLRRHPFDKAEIVTGKGKKVVLAVLAPAQAGKPAKGEQPAVPAQPEVRVTYELEDGQPYLVVRSVFKNALAEPLEFALEDDLRADNFDAKARNAVHDLFWVQDRYFGQAYAVVADGYQIKSQSDATRLSKLDYLPKGKESSKITLKPGDTHELVRWLIPGPDLLSVKGTLLQVRKQPIAQCEYAVTDESGAPIAGAEVTLKRGEEDYGSGRTGDNGRLAFLLPPGQYQDSVRAVGRGSVTSILEVAEGAGVNLVQASRRLPVAPLVTGEITDEKGGPIPCKVQFKGMNGTTNPNWGPPAAREAVTNLFYSNTGKFTVPISPGEYEAIISYGPEYDMVRVPLKVGKAEKVPLKATLKRAVRSPGWVSSDFHSHASPSGDNTSDQRGRVLNLLCEHIEFAPCTEHNRLDSYTPHLKALGVEKLMGTCTGIELTGTPLPLDHHNAFPLKMKPRTQDNGAPLTDISPEKQIRRLYEWDDKSEKLVQQNHPDIGWLFFDKDGDDKPDGGYKEGFPYMHVIEVHPIHEILDMKPTRIRVNTMGRREVHNAPIFNWLQLLNQGHRIPGVVNTDAHYNFHGSGGLRNWVRCDQETPGSIDPLEIVCQSRKGRIIMSTGPYMEVKLGDALPGDDAKLENGKGALQVRVQCPNWLDIDRVQVLVNGRPDPKLNFTRKDHADKFGKGVVKFDQKIDLALGKDAHLIVVAVGEESEVGEVMGPLWGKQKPVAISNPIYVDVDGGGFKPNRDTLDAPLPVKGGKPVTEAKP